MEDQTSIIKQSMTKEEWLQAWYDKNQSINSVGVAKTTLNHYYKFLAEKYQNIPEERIINEIRNSNDNRVYFLLNQFVQYLNKNVNRPKSIRNYYGFLKSYLRAQGIMIINDYAKTMVQIPKIIEPEKKPLELDIIKQILQAASPIRKAFYLSMISSITRPRETLQWKKNHLTIEEDGTILIRMPAPITKNRIKRETFISAEAWRHLQPFYEKTAEHGFLFCDEYDPKSTLSAEEEYFGKIRRLCGLEEKVNGSPRYLVHIYSFKDYSFSLASDNIGGDYARAMAGHKGYMQTYYTKTIEQRKEMYKRFEPHITINYPNV